MVKKTNPKTDSKILELESKITELNTNYLRVLADFQNQTRRHKEQESQIVKMANSSLIEKLLFVVDSLKLAENHLKDPGLIMIIGQFIKILESEGLTKIETTGKSFDPITMDCVETVDGEKDLVVETLSEGYNLFDKVLRPAKVKVGSGLIT
jgi:molecular chaperone GrpE